MFELMLCVSVNNCSHVGTLRPYHRTSNQHLDSVLIKKATTACMYVCIAGLTKPLLLDRIKPINSFKPDIPFMGHRQTA